MTATLEPLAGLSPNLPVAMLRDAWAKATPAERTAAIASTLPRVATIVAAIRKDKDAEAIVVMTRALGRGGAGWIDFYSRRLDAVVVLARDATVEVSGPFAALPRWYLDEIETLRLYGAETDRVLRDALAAKRAFGPATMLDPPEGQTVPRGWRAIGKDGFDATPPPAMREPTPDPGDHEDPPEDRYDLSDDVR